MHQPSQIAKLLELAKDTQGIPGSYIEVGCAYGATTVLMMKYFKELGLKRKGYALDTFSGFEQAHADYDIKQLGKDASLQYDFRRNDISWMRATLRVSGIDNVTVVKGDATQFNFNECGEIAFALLDVDLYQPIADILPKLYSRLAPGGIIVVDDCAPSPKWEGALIAYREFVDTLGAPSEILCGKLGIVRRPNEAKETIDPSLVAA